MIRHEPWFISLHEQTGHANKEELRYRVGCLYAAGAVADAQRQLDAAKDAGDIGPEWHLMEYDIRSEAWDWYQSQASRRPSFVRRVRTELKANI